MAEAMSPPGKKKFQRWRRPAQAGAISLALLSLTLLPGCGAFMAGAYATSAVQLWMNRDKYFGAPPPHTAKMQDPRPRRRHASSWQAARQHKPGLHFTAKKQDRKAAAPTALATHNGAAPLAF
jgi:hypothetical protein